MMRNTIQRSLIKNAVEELNIHATAEQVYEHIIKQHPNISKATVYRNLSQMAETGELRNIGVLFGNTHYDHNCHQHYHFICKNCKRVFDVDEDLADVFEKLKFKVVNVTFDGLCNDCNV